MKGNCFPCLLAVGLIELALSAMPSSATESQLITVAVSEGDKVLIQVPRNWQHKVLQHSAEQPPTVWIAGVSNSVSLQITILPDREGRLVTRESVDKAAAQANQHYIAGSLEKRLSLSEIVSTNGLGCYAVFTDADLAGVAHPRPGEFKNVISGLFVIKRHIATFTLLTNDPKSVECRQALEIISDGISIP